MKLSIWNGQYKTSVDKSTGEQVLRTHITIHTTHPITKEGLDEYKQFKEVIINLIKMYDPTANEAPLKYPLDKKEVKKEDSENGAVRKENTND